MTQREATNIIFELAPELSKGSPPEVLSKYARAHNLAPAQLQRLGNVFNTASVLVQQDKDKSAAPYLIDVPDMVSDFVSNYKAKRATSIFDEALEPVVEKAASAPDETFGWLQKEAKVAQEEKGKDWRDPRRELELGIHVTKEALTHLEDLWPQAITAMNKLAAQLVVGEDPSLSFNTLLQDYETIHNRDSGEFGTKLAQACQDLGCNVVRHQLTAPVLYRDHTGLLPQALKAAALQDEVDTTWQVIENGASLALSHKEAFIHDLYQQRGIEQITCELRKAADRCGLAKAALAQKKEEGSQARQGAAFGDYAADYADKGMEDGSFWRTAGGAAGAGAAIPFRALSGASDGVRALPGIWNEFTTEGTTAQSLDALVGQDNRRKADGDALDLQRIRRDAEALGVFQKVVMTDDVLSRKDPTKVFEAWQTIRSASPEVATDTTILRLMLRSALETQGVDIDSATAARKYEFGSYNQPVNSDNSPSLPRPTAPRA